MYCSAQPCLALSQSLAYLLICAVARWCGARHLTGRVHNIINIRNFIKLLGKEVENSTKDLIKDVADRLTNHLIRL